MKNSQILILNAERTLTLEIRKCLIASQVKNENIFYCAYEDLNGKHKPARLDIALVPLPEPAAEKAQIRATLEQLFPSVSIVWLLRESELQHLSGCDLQSEDYILIGQFLAYDLPRSLRYVSTMRQYKKAQIVDCRNATNQLHLEQKSKHLESVINAVTSGFFTMDSSWRFTSVNKECERVTRRCRTQLLGQCILDIFPHIKTLKYYSECTRAMRDNVSVHFEEYDLIYDTWISINAYPTQEGLAVYFNDITEQKKMQEKIFVNEQNLRAIINNTSDLIWSLNKAGEIISANNAFWERLHQLTGRLDASITRFDLGAARHQAWQEFFDRAFAGETFKILSDEIRNGQRVFEETSFNPIRNNNNEVIGVSCFSRDITENHLHLQKIEEQNERLKKIAWTQSHEVRRPLANILGLTEMLQFNPGSPDSTQVISHIEAAAVELDGVIKKISAFTFAESA